MRILSYNIHGCIGRDRREKPERILEVIQQADADIVGLQEVHSADALDRDFLRKLEGLPYRAILYGKTITLCIGPDRYSRKISQLSIRDR